MHLCAYWDCAHEIGDEVLFCPEHSLKMDKGLIDQCPKCGRYKDTRYKLCPDCQYGRPIPNWKIGSRMAKTKGSTEVDRSEEQENSGTEKPVGYARSKYSERLAGKGVDKSSQQGEAQCPRCGSSNLTYKNVFDYFKCNNCDSTFITPVYSHGEGEKGSEIESTKDLTSQIFGESHPDIQEEKEIEPIENITQKHKPSNLRWLLLLLTIAILSAISVAVWAIFGKEIEHLLSVLL